ncbi:MAG: 4Fe-4S binding protein [Betaproteobacteria bacterium]|nr:4Fe-4S binding protein [Betaproteobacteria bacterium]
MPTLICDCNQTLPLAVPKTLATLGQALNETLSLHSGLCRREAGAFQQAVMSGDDVVVACTQERRLFVELAGQTEGATSVIRFVNIRETGGWGKGGAQAAPKIAALLAAAHLPDPEPVATVSFKSAGRLLIIGALDKAEALADSVSDVLQVSIFASQGGNGAQERRYPVLAGQIDTLTGWLGAFDLQWTKNNPIDLDLCTRCNACVAVCPEGAIGLDYQINSKLCLSHKRCTDVCKVAGAIDFARAPQALTDSFDLVLDLREHTAFMRHAPPQGYFHTPAPDLATVLKIRDLVGEFEKPRFFAYKQKLCAHSRNETVGCRACIDICSAEAISSDKSRQQIKVNPSLCVGCGACTTVCPSGALTYAYPRATDQGQKIKTLLSTYAKAGGKDATLLFHSQGAGQKLVEELGRAAQLGVAQGVPAQVIPVGVWHTASMGLELWLSAIAQGAARVAVLCTSEEAPQYRQGLQDQMAVAQAILTGLGYGGQHLQMLQANTMPSLDTDLAMLAKAPAQTVAVAASFAPAAEKRSTLELALDHLLEHAPLKSLPEHIALPPASPLGNLTVDKDKCTLCLACVSACPSNALSDNPQSPQLRLTEKNCVQCGLCVKTCPEKAISLQPRLLLTPARKEPRVLNEAQPYGCVRCGKPFGTLKGIEAMLAKLSGHAMFQGAALERLKMCGDCRVIDIYSADHETRIDKL